MKKNTLRIWAAFGLVLSLAAGCVMNPVPPPDRRVTIAEDLGTDAYVTDIRCVKNASGFLTLQANVVNNTRSDLGVEWKTVWLDSDGMTIDSVVSSWNKIMISPKGISALKSTSPNPAAVDMMIHLRALRR